MKLRGYLWATFLAALVLALTYALQAPVDRAAVRPSVWDYRVYYCAALAVRERTDPYRLEPLRTCEHSARYDAREPPWSVSPFVLPGYAAAAMLPLAYLPYGAGKALWLFVLFAGFCVAAACTAAFSKTPVVAVAAAFAPTVAFLNFQYGEPVPLAIAGLCLAAHSMHVGKPKLAAIFVLLAMIEPHVGTPAALALFVFSPHARRTLILGGAGLAILSLVALGPSANLEYFRDLLPANQHAELFSVDQYSLSRVAFLSGLPANSAMLLGTLSYAVAILCSFALVLRSLREGWSAAMVIVLPVALAMLGGPFVHDVQIAAAMPAAVLVASRLPAGAAALALLTVRWDQSWRAIVFLTPIAVAGSIAISFRRASRMHLVAYAGAALLCIGVLYAFATFQTSQSWTAGAPPTVPLGPNTLSSVAWEWRIRLTPAATTPELGAILMKLPTWFALVLIPLALIFQSWGETGRRALASHATETTR